MRREQVWQKVLAGCEPGYALYYALLFVGVLFLAPLVGLTRIGNPYVAAAYFGCSIACWLVALQAARKRMVAARELMIPFFARRIVEGVILLAVLQAALPSVLAGLIRLSVNEAILSFALQSCFIMSALLLMKLAFDKTGPVAAEWIAPALMIVAFCGFYAGVVLTTLHASFVWVVACTDIVLACALIWFYWPSPVEWNSTFGGVVRTAADAAIWSVTRTLAQQAKAAGGQHQTSLPAGGVFGTETADRKVMTAVEGLRCIVSQGFEKLMGWKEIANGLSRRVFAIIFSVGMIFFTRHTLPNGHVVSPSTITIAWIFFNVSTEEVMKSTRSFFREATGSREFVALLPGLGHRWSLKLNVLKACFYPVLRASIFDFVCINIVIIIVFVMYFEEYSVFIAPEAVILNVLCVLSMFPRFHIIIRVLSCQNEHGISLLFLYVAFAALVVFLVQTVMDAAYFGSVILGAVCLLIGVGVLILFLTDWYEFKRRPHLFLPGKQGGVDFKHLFT